MKKMIGFLVFMMAIAFMSCQSEKVDDPVDEEMSEKSAQISLTEVNLEAATNEVEYEVEFYANAEEIISNWWKVGKTWRWTNHLRYQLNHCPAVSIENGEDDGYPKIITLDYGDSTELKNGKILSGVIEIEISARRSSKDYKRMVSYTDFGVDSLLFNGSSLVTVDKVDEMIRSFKSDITVNLADGINTIQRTSERTWTWVEGLDTREDQTDDKIEITGVVNAMHSKWGTYKKEIVEPLIRIKDCRYIVSGIVQIWINTTLISSLDYGDGECNGFAILTKEGDTYEVDLSKRKMKKRN